MSAPTKPIALAVFAAILALSAAAPALAGHGRRTFADCRGCPPMTVVPAGRFMIGSPPGEAGRYDREGPRREIRIAAMAVGSTEVTRGQYRRFAKATKRPLAHDCTTQGDGSSFAEDAAAPRASWRDPGFAQTDAHPVVCVSWQDASAYAAWLSRLTHRHYRLLSEAEWEYAARAGSSAAFFWGPTAKGACAYANGSDPSLVRALPAWIETVRRAARDGDRRAGILPCDDGFAFTAPAGHYRPNAFGLYDMSGNVWEHVADCFVDGGFEAMAPDGRAQERPGCHLRRVRGGSWDDYAIDLRSARRTGGLSPTQRRNDTGFRVARAL